MVRRITLPFVLLALAACGDDEVPFFDAAALCADGGGPFNCSCPGGTTGTQTCLDDDTLSACDCPVAVDAGADLGADLGFDVSTDIDLDSGVTTCADASECAEGEDCVGGICVEEPEPEYRYVAIVSNAAANDALDSVNPGPDIDAIQLLRGEESFFATVVEVAVTGAGGTEENLNDDVASVTGPNDAIPDLDASEDCDLSDAADGGRYHSMGGTDGFVVVSFGTGVSVEDGDILRVFELGIGCPNISTNRPDAYSVYLGTNVAGVTSVDDISPDAGWMQAGASGPDGGILDVFVALEQ